MNSGKRAVVYTAVVGNYDFLRKVPGIFSDIDFVCFTDGSVSESQCRQKGWLYRELPSEAETSRKGCRLLKSMPHQFFESYDVSIWVDANVTFQPELAKLVEEFIGDEVLIRGFQHPSRTCAYAEAKQCISQKKDTEENLNAMVSHMREAGFPENNGLTETNVLFRKHNSEKVRALSEDWLRCLTEFTVRDQISFDFLRWLHGVDIRYFNGSTHGYTHSVFDRGLHKSSGLAKSTFAYLESVQGNHRILRSLIRFLYRRFG